MLYVLLKALVFDFIYNCLLAGSIYDMGARVFARCCCADGWLIQGLLGIGEIFVFSDEIFFKVQLLKYGNIAFYIICIVLQLNLVGSFGFTWRELCFGHGILNFVAVFVYQPCSSGELRSRDYIIVIYGVYNGLFAGFPDNVEAGFFVHGFCLQLYDLQRLIFVVLILMGCNQLAPFIKLFIDDYILPGILGCIRKSYIHGIGSIFGTRRELFLGSRSVYSLAVLVCQPYFALEGLAGNQSLIRYRVGNVLFAHTGDHLKAGFRSGCLCLNLRKFHRLRLVVDVMMCAEEYAFFIHVFISHELFPDDNSGAVELECNIHITIRLGWSEFHRLGYDFIAVLIQCFFAGGLIHQGSSEFVFFIRLQILVSHPVF